MLSMFSPLKKQEKQDYFLDNHLDGCLLSEKEFATRLRHERLRSERSGLPVALVIIDFAGLLDVIVEKKAVSPQVFVRHLADILRTYTREIDLKGWYPGRKFALIVADSDEASAQVVVEKFTRLMAEKACSNSTFGQDDLRRFISISYLQGGCSYLGSSLDPEKSKAKPSARDKRYCIEFSSPGPGVPYCMITNRTICVAAAQWPFSLEILSQIRGKDLQLGVKRVVDIIGSLTGILLFSPLMLLIAVLIKVTSPGPVLFRQERLGHLGKPFIFLKFRSMKVACDASIHRDYVTRLIKGENSEINEGTADQPVYKITEDHRVTSIGRFLRKSSLDELPQFFNVLKGDMSLVGPRPPIPYECDQYRRWHCNRVLEVKPGITGLWQVSGRSSTTFDEMVRLDLKYVRTWNLWLDIRILFKTFWSMILAKGGY